MRTHLDCIPCFFRQALETARICGASPAIQRSVLHEVAKNLHAFSLKISPPEIARMVYGIVKTATGRNDPYHKMKKQSNRLALRVYPQLQNSVAASDDRLRRATEIAIAGNIIDFGVSSSLDVKQELEKIARTDTHFTRKDNATLFHFQDFAVAAEQATNILYLADNAGETVFDKILIEELKRAGARRKITYAVRESAIINDALIEDARQCGIDKITTVVSSGSDAPGTILPLCSKEFRKIYRASDLVISKGQGNFETLSEEKKPIFFLLKAKCEVVAEHIGCDPGDSLLLYNRKL